MRFNLGEANNLMDKYKLDAILFLDPLSLKYFGYDLYCNSAREWMLKPGGTNNYGMINLCLLPYKKNPIYIINAFSLSSLSLEVISNYEILSFGPFVQPKEKRQIFEHGSHSRNIMDNRIIGILNKGIFKDCIEALDYAIDKCNLKNSKLAIEKDCIDKELIHNIKSAFPFAYFYNGSELIRLIRMVKTVEEISIIEKCCQITEEAFLNTLNSIKEEPLLKDLKKKFQSEVEDQNSFYEHFFVFPKGLGMTEYDDYIIEKNNIMGFDAGVVYEGYTSDTGLTLFFGRSGKKDLETYKKLFDLIESGVQAVKPGVRCSQVFKRMLEKKDHYEFKDHSFEGHGVGLSFREYPAINSKIGYKYNIGFEDINSDFIIKKGMVINFETCLNFYNEKTFQIEKTIIVTESGSRSIEFQNRKEPVFL